MTGLYRRRCNQLEEVDLAGRAHLLVCLCPCKRRESDASVTMARAHHSSSLTATRPSRPFAWTLSRANGSSSSKSVEYISSPGTLKVARAIATTPVPAPSSMQVLFRHLCGSVSTRCLRYLARTTVDGKLSRALHDYIYSTHTCTRPQVLQVNSQPVSVCHVATGIRHYIHLRNLPLTPSALQCTTHSESCSPGPASVIKRSSIGKKLKSESFAWPRSSSF